MSIYDRLPNLAVPMLMLAIIGAGVVAVGAGILPGSATAATDEACEPQPTTLRYDRDRSEKFLAYRLTWVRDQECPSDEYRIYRYTDGVKELIGTTTKTNYVDRDAPGDVELIYLVKAVKDGKEGRGVSITAQRPPKPTKKPAPVATDPAPVVILERSLVCFYEQDGNIHSVSGLRECTMAEINKALAEPAQ